ncbi:MAG: hypothetical protein ACTSUE_26970, partial [Promethearchaeota archaeon]
EDIIGGSMGVYLHISIPGDNVGMWYKSQNVATPTIAATSLSVNITFPGSAPHGASACTGIFNLSITGNSLAMDSRIDFIVDESSISLAGLSMEVPFTRDGYDVSLNATPFSRFFADRGDYVPIEQFKRRTHLGGPGLGSYFNWLVATGVDGLGYDLNFTNFNLRSSFYIQDDMLGIWFPGTGIVDLTSTKTYTHHFEFHIQSPEPGIPGQYPRFFTSNTAFDSLLNNMLIERSFSWSPNTGQTDWLDWQNTIVDWMDTPYLPAMKSQLLNMNVEPNGYVYTWGDKIGWPFPDNDVYNTRHYTSNPNFILGSYRYFSWTKDESFLSAIYPKLHAATQYILNNMSLWDGLFVITAPDHEGLGLQYEKEDPNYSPLAFQSCGSNYWDILPFGYKSAYCNAYIQAALRSMAGIETFLGNTSRFNELSNIADQQRDTYNKVFWNQDRGRYIGGIDVQGNAHDHGFTFLNMEAIYYGIANHTQAMRIYDWMENEPTASGLKDTYTAFIFAPRATTDINEYWWHADVSDFNYQVQDGGAILYTSGYDIRSRARYLGSENALDRITGMLDRYSLPDKLCGGNPRYLGNLAQQEDAGAVGTDVPFPESGLAPVGFIESILGIRVNSTSFIIEPELPSTLDHAGVHGIQVASVKMDINITPSTINITYLSGVPQYNFTIACDDLLHNVQDLIGNISIELPNRGMEDLASQLLVASGLAKNASITGGTFLDIHGINKTGELNTLHSIAMSQNQSGHFSESINTSRYLLNMTGFLMNESTYQSFVQENGSVLNTLSEYQGRKLLSYKARELRKAAIDELGFALESRDRGCGWWFFEHVKRAHTYITRADEEERNSLFLHINVYFILPSFIIGISLLGLIRRRKLLNIPLTGQEQ